MAEDLLHEYPELRPFVLTDVRLTGTRIGAGAYGSVEEVAVPVSATARKIHHVLQDLSEIPEDEIRSASKQIVKECQLMRTLRHPHIVQFLGVCFFPESRLPALVMERLLTSLHDLLDPESKPPPGVTRPLSFFTMSLKCSVLHNVASGLAYLHERSPPIIHQDLSAGSILLNSEMVAKIADLGMAHILHCMRAAATLTKAPRACVYTPPEAVEPSASNQKSKHDATVAIFSLGVVAIFTLGENFPCDLLAPTYTDESSGMLVARTELQRRSKYMENVNTQLQACGQLRGDHPLIQLVQQCLQNVPSKRPDIREVLCLLEEARGCLRDEESERNKQELVLAIQNLSRNQPGNQNLECVVQDLLTKNAALQHKLQSSEMEKQTIRQQLMRKEAELTRAEETIQREQQQRQQNIELVKSKEKELAHAEQQLRKKEEQLRSSKTLVADLQRKCVPYTCQVSGPGLQQATVSHSTRVIVELTDSRGSPASHRQNVTAQLEPVSEEVTPTKPSRWPWSKKSEKRISVTTTSPSRYSVSYTAVSRGKHKLHIHVNNTEISGSPFTVTVYPDPTQLGQPVRFVNVLKEPYGITINSRGETVVSECSGHKVSIFDIREQKIRSFGSYGDNPDQMKSPKGLASDDMDNIYVSSRDKLQKFTSSGELVKCATKWHRNKELDDPRGVTLYNDQVYVCDRNNHRIHVFDLDLNFVRSIGSYGNGKHEFNSPLDVKFNTAGDIYVADWGNERVQVIDSSGHFIREFGQDEKGKLAGPSGLQVADKYVYVSDYSRDCIVVYETSGQFVTSFGRHGRREGELFSPYCITSCADGFIHVCDHTNNRVQIF